MIECYIYCHKSEKQILKIKVSWWDDYKLKKEHNFYQVEFGGEIDDHLTDTRQELKAIHEAHLPEKNPRHGSAKFVPWFERKI